MRCNHWIFWSSNLPTIVVAEDFDQVEWTCCFYFPPFSICADFYTRFQAAAVKMYSFLIYKAWPVPSIIPPSRPPSWINTLWNRKCMHWTHAWCVNAGPECSSHPCAAICTVRHTVLYYQYLTRGLRPSASHMTHLMNICISVLSALAGKRFFPAWLVLMEGDALRDGSW